MISKTADFLAARSTAEAVRCPRCAADPGAVCVNVRTGEPLANIAAHWDRIRTSRAKQLGASEDEGLAKDTGGAP